MRIASNNPSEVAHAQSVYVHSRNVNFSCGCLAILGAWWCNYLHCSAAQAILRIRVKFPVMRCTHECVHITTPIFEYIKESSPMEPSDFCAAALVRGSTQSIDVGLAGDATPTDTVGCGEGVRYAHRHSW